MANMQKYAVQVWQLSEIETFQQNYGLRICFWRIPSTIFKILFFLHVTLASQAQLTSSSNAMFSRYCNK